MKRVLLGAVAMIAALLAIAAGVYAVRARSTSQKPAAHADAAGQQPMAGMPADPKPSDAGKPTTTPRGDVTIDTRRQQLIGVRTARVTREPMQRALRTVG